ncbi:periplasmic component of the Tol biopolymer transport system [Longilinea arvoryzae]|uniref:Periplasmic component of the Tol biopolymer transport system n=1 Tax=Longilinea arvoryzae TaxID=360412 RepID=A0A0S7BKR4_9CHLR|nr:Ig-like domain-containing protein [Longilinea arvoryzae]GAP14389.1 periplasmic component of the Tol biopolymer transport system [Longilinea arvoryzae]
MPYAILILLAVIGIFFWLGSQVGMSKPEIRLPDGAEIGARGPLILEFHQAVTAADIEAHLHLEPAVEGKWTWEGNQTTFWPAGVFQAGQIYTLRLDRGVVDETGHRLKSDAVWSFRIRAASILYLGQATQAPEVWLADAAGNAAKQLSESGGRVQDMAGFPSGERVVYSATNDQAGVDLWLVNRDGADNHRLLDCGPDACVQPSVAPDESAITFSRRSPNAPLGEIWTFDLKTGESSALHTDQTISGIEPDWSPLGRYLQFYDPEYSQIRVLDLITNKVILIPTEQQAIGTWSPDGTKLLFTRAESSEIGVPFVRIYQADLESGDIQLVEAADLGQVDASRPIFTPDGNSLVIALRALVGSPNKQLWLVPLENGASQSITEDLTASFAAYSWDPNGRQLVFQRFQLESSQSTPQVMTWQKDDKAFQVIAEDAARPQWLP